ncbi:hypothetical protein LZC95_50085 [Pendulispora brunnea]|uniref:Uncharacterized protein n=1 Tax=Pendulispora brunnea TaxID=2905690 RepID=A0ABZ2K799_9BACT
MQKRRDAPGPLNVEALYTMAQLCAVVGPSWTEWSLSRLLEKNGVEFVRSGRAKFVPLCEIEKKIPSLWESLKAAEVLRRGR